MPAPHHSFLQAVWPSCHRTNSIKALAEKLFYILPSDNVSLNYSVDVLLNSLIQSSNTAWNK